MHTRSKLRVALGLGLALSVCALAMPIRFGVVVGNSMSPSLRNGNIYLFNRGKEAETLHSGDVVIFRRDGVNYIKRVVALGGDQIYVTTIPSSGRDELVMDWQLNGMRKAFSHPERFRVKVVARTVPPGYCYVVGDHISASVDSRELGPIPTDLILGKLIGAPVPTSELEHLAVINSNSLAGKKS